MKKIAFAIALALLALSCSRKAPDSLVVEAPFGIAPASPSLVFRPSGDGQNFLSVERSKIAAKPGYVIAFDKAAGAQTECSAVLHLLCYRFSWPKGAGHYMLFDPSDFGYGPMAVIQSGSSEIVASSENFFACIRTSSEIVKFEPQEGGRVLVTFEDKWGTVTLVAGLSHTSLGEARSNLNSEAGNDMFSLDEVVFDSAAAWQSADCIKVAGGSKAALAALAEGKRKAATMIRIGSDNRKTYRNREGKVTRAHFDNAYSKPDDWREVEAWAPLAALIYPNILTDFCLSCCDMYGTEGEYLPAEAYPIVAGAYNRGMMSSLNAEYWALIKESLGEPSFASDLSDTDSYKTLALMGLVPDSAPGTGYTFCAPAFKTITIQLGDGNVLKITSKVSPKSAPKTVLFNGAELPDGHIELADLLAGGEIVLK